MVLVLEAIQRKVADLIANATLYMDHNYLHATIIYVSVQRSRI